MLGRRGARAGRGMPRGWTALCLLTLLREYPPRAAAGLDGEGRALSPPRGGQGSLPPSKPLRPGPLQAAGSEPLTCDSAGLGRAGEATTPRVCTSPGVTPRRAPGVPQWDSATRWSCL